MEKEKSLAKNTIIIFIGKVSTQFISFLMLPLYTAYLATEEYGTVDLINTYVQLLGPVICLGLQNAAFRFLVDSRKNEEEKEKIISNIFIFTLVLFAIFAVGYLILNIFIEIKFYNYIIFNLLGFIFFEICLQISRGLGNNKSFTIASAMSSLLTVILNVTFIIFFKWGAKGMLMSMAISNFLGGIFIVLKLKIYKYINHRKLKLKTIKELLTYSFPLVPSGISWWVVSASDRTIISAFLGVAANGIYAIACKFSSIINIFTNIFTLSWTESASLNINKEGKDIFFSKIINTAVRFFASLCIGMMACMPFAFNILIDNQYVEAYNYIPILLLGSFFNVFVSVYSSIYVAKKLTKQVANTSIIAAIINIVVNLALIKFIGIYAAAISTAIAYGVMMIYRHNDLKKYMNLRIDVRMIKILLLVFLGTIICYYSKNIIVNIINLIFIILFTFYINRKIIKGFIKIALDKYNNIFKRS